MQRRNTNKQVGQMETENVDDRDKLPDKRNCEGNATQLCRNDDFSFLHFVSIFSHSLYIFCSSQMNILTFAVGLIASFLQLSVVLVLSETKIFFPPLKDCMHEG